MSAGWPAVVADLCARALAEHGVPGVALAVARDGRPVLRQGCGHRDREAGLPVTPGTVFGIASCTKSFTAAAVMLLQEAGRLSVQDPVVRYLPAFRLPDPAATRAVTLHHLLTHTSGLPPLPSRQLALARSTLADPDAAATDLVRAHPPIDTWADLLAFLAEWDFTPLGPPGAYFSYSNDGYALLGAVVERVSDEPYAEFVARRILQAAGMAASSFRLADALVAPEVTVLYAARQREGRREVYRSPVWEDGAVWDPAGGLKSIVDDLLRYLEIYRTGGCAGGRRLLAEASVRAMTYPHVVRADHGHPALPPGAAYGYGLAVVPRRDGTTWIGHGGGRKGVAAHLGLIPELGVTGAVLTNLAGAPAEPLLAAALQLAAGRPPTPDPAPWPAYACPAARLAAYCGTYRSGEGAELHVASDGGGLSLRVGGARHPLRPVGPDTFAYPAGEAEACLRFLVDGDGPARAVTFGLRIVPRAGDSPCRCRHARSSCAAPSPPSCATASS